MFGDVFFCAWYTRFIVLYVVCNPISDSRGRRSTCPSPFANSKVETRHLFLPGRLVGVYFTEWSMLAFIYLAYRMMASLFEKVPTLKDVGMHHHSRKK